MSKEIEGHQVHQDHLDLKVKEVRLEKKVCVARLVYQDRMEEMDHQAVEVKEVKLDQRVKMAHQD